MDYKVDGQLYFMIGMVVGVIMMMSLGWV